MGSSTGQPIQATSSNSMLVADPMPRSKTTNTYIHCRVSQAISSGLQQAAKDDDRTVSYIMRQAFEEYLESRGYLTADA